MSRKKPVSARSSTSKAKLLQEAWAEDDEMVLLDLVYRLEVHPVHSVLFITSIVYILIYISFILSL